MGLPCSGKTTLAEKFQRGCGCVHLDGDVFRDGLCLDLGFSPKDRSENLRRAATIADMLNKQGYNVAASFITPTNKSQQMLEGWIENLKTVYVKCPVEVCAMRDVKGMYLKAIEGDIENFTGISAPFEEPECDIVLPTDVLTENECLQNLLLELR